MTHLSEPVFSVLLAILQFGSQPGAGNLGITGTRSPVAYVLDAVQCCFQCVTAHVIEDAALQI